MKKRDFRRLIQRCGVNYTDADSIAARVVEQISRQGAENTAMYLKRVGDGVLWSMDSEYTKPEWVHFRHGFPVFFRELKRYPDRTKITMAKFARSIRLTAATNKQLKKTMSAVTEPFKGSWSSVDEISRLCGLGISRLGLVSTDISPSYPLVGRQFCKVLTTSSKALLVPGQVVSKPPIRDSLAILRRFPWLQMPGWQTSFYPLSRESLYTALDAVEEAPDELGVIQINQEGGAKGRQFAAPYTGVQVFASPVYDWLAKIARQIPAICTWEQSLGAEEAQRWLNQGSKIFAFDLSTATCRTPLETQLSVMRSLGAPQHLIDVVFRISRGRWRVGDSIACRGKFPSHVQWTVGQPMGVRFSIVLFTLWHATLLAGISASLGLNPWEGYKVLGDDVVIHSPLVAEVYSQLVCSAGIEISWAKSHRSSTMSEFAGYTITKTDLVRPGQFREVVPNNLLQLAETYGILPDTSKLYSRVCKIHLFGLGQYVPPVEEYSRYLRMNSSLINAWDSLPEFKTRAPFWLTRIKGVYTEALASLNGQRVEVPPFCLRDMPLSPGMSINYRGGVVFDYARVNPNGVWDILPHGDARFVWESNYTQLRFSNAKTLQDVLYYVWMAIYSSVVIGEVSPSDAMDQVDRVLAFLHSLLYLPPRSKSRSSRVKRLVSLVLTDLTVA